MTPRPDVVMVPAGALATEALDVALERGFSRIPVYQDSVDRVLGTVSVRDIAETIRNNEQTPAAVETVMRDAYFVPEAKMVDDALADMQSSRVHMAIVVDEYGDTAGIVTMEDIIEEIVGDIADESDRELTSFIALNENEAVVDGTFSIADLNDEMDLALTADEADTIAGLVFVTLGRVPDEGDRIAVDGASVQVLRIENTRIQRLKVTKLPVESGSDGEGDEAI
jgi:CBS domain containing-hemolysin-like protein